MWENETIVLLTSLKRRVIGDNTDIRISNILKDEAIPEFIKKIFESKVEQYLASENPLSVQKTKHFHLTDEDLKKIWQGSTEVISRAAFFNRDEVEKIIQEGLVLRLDYLVKPVSTMRKQLFQNANSVPLTTIKETLLPLASLVTYSGRLLEECENRSLTELTQSQYTEFIETMFPEETSPEAVTEIIKDFSLLTDFLSQAKGEDVQYLEIDIVKDFLADRNYWGFRRAMEVEERLNKDTFSALDVELTLRRYIELKSDFNENPKADKTDEPLIRDDEEKDSVELIDAALGGEGEALDLGEVWGESEEEEIPAVEIEQPEIMPEEEKPMENAGKGMRIIRREKKGETEEQPLEPENMETETREEEVVEAPAPIEKEEEPAPEAKEDDVPARKKEPLESKIDDKTRKSLIKKLFGGDAGSYSSLLQQLEEAESWRVAKILIDNELFKRDVDPFSREAIKLVDLIYGRFYPEESVGGV